MRTDNDEVRSHYAAMLARNYLWMAGGMGPAVEKNIRFFRETGVTPSGKGTAIDLGAGCGFQSIALATGGFDVTAVDFSEKMLEILSRHAGNLPLRTLQSDILAFTAWEGRHPELIVCMGDTLTYLPDMTGVRNLVCHAARDLAPGGKLIVSFRDYSGEPAGSTIIIPVQRDPGRIFVCRLDYGNEKVRVTDILYTRESGRWERVAGSCSKLRIAPGVLVDIMTGEGLVVHEPAEDTGMTTIIAEKTPVPE